MNWNYVFTALRDVCFSTSIWCFAFRYWNISFVMLVQLKGEEVSTRFKAFSITVFLTGLIFNILIPVLRSVFAIEMNEGENYKTQLEAYDDHK